MKPDPAAKSYDSLTLRQAALVAQLRLSAHSRQPR